MIIDFVSIIRDDTGARIAARVRLEREARDWTLEHLAARAGVSRAMISKIERFEASPTAATLVRLAGAFDLTLAGLLAGGEEARGPLVRAADQPRWRDPATGYLRRQIFGRPGHPVEMVRIELPAGARVGFPASSYARIRQLVWVMKGRMVIEEGAQRHQLAAGDCLAFGTPADTTFANESANACTYLVAIARS
jgi:transcriptional regulator with XRE-family HTH domain